MSSDTIQKHIKNELTKEEDKEQIFDISNLIVSFSSVIKKYFSKNVNFENKNLSLKENETEIKRILTTEFAETIKEYSRKLALL